MVIVAPFAAAWAEALIACGGAGGRFVAAAASTTFVGATALVTSCLLNLLVVIACLIGKEEGRALIVSGAAPGVGPSQFAAATR